MWEQLNLKTNSAALRSGKAEHSTAPSIRKLGTAGKRSINNDMKFIGKE